MKLVKKRSAAKKATKLIKATVEKLDMSLDEEMPDANPKNHEKKKQKKKTTRVYMMCSDCDLPIFASLDDEDVCKCAPTGIYGCFWQEPDESKPVVRTFACYRVGKKSYWSTVKTKTGKRSEVEMVLKFPAVRKMNFDPDDLKKIV